MTREVPSAEQEFLEILVDAVMRQQQCTRDVALVFIETQGATRPDQTVQEYVEQVLPALQSQTLIQLQRLGFQSRRLMGTVNPAHAAQAYRDAMRRGGGERTGEQVDSEA